MRFATFYEAFPSIALREKCDSLNYIIVKTLKFHCKLLKSKNFRIIVESCYFHN